MCCVPAIETGAAQAGYANAVTLSDTRSAAATSTPGFQFDAETAKVRPLVAEINHLLDARHDPWGVGSWWLSPSGWLPNGQSPADLAVLGGQDEVIRDIAGDLLAD